MELLKQDFRADKTVYPEYAWKKKTKRKSVTVITVLVEWVETPEMRIWLVANENTHKPTNMLVHSVKCGKKEAHSIKQEEIRRVCYF